jgi:hypothetical protein
MGCTPRAGTAQSTTPARFRRPAPAATTVAGRWGSTHVPARNVSRCCSQAGARRASRGCEGFAGCGRGQGCTSQTQAVTERRQQRQRQAAQRRSRSRLADRHRDHPCRASNRDRRRLQVSIQRGTKAAQHLLTALQLPLQLRNLSGRSALQAVQERCRPNVNCCVQQRSRPRHLHGA